jgi:transcriptional regulator with XRE-family HTH domain
MFEPMPTLIRLERERQGLTQDALAKLAQISRSRLAAVEKGDDNLTLKLLLKVTNTLGIQELRVGGLHVQAAAPELAVLVVAAEAITTARKLIQQASQAAAAGAELERSASPVFALLAQHLHQVPDTGLAQAAARLATSTADPRQDARALRTAVESAGVVDAPERSGAATKPAAARRTAR